MTIEEKLKAALKLASLVTVQQVIEAGYDYIEAAALNPWCINEGLASGGEAIDLSHLEPKAD